MKLIALIITLFTAAELVAQHDHDALEDKQSFLQWMIQDASLLESMQPRHPQTMMLGEFPKKDIDTTIDVQSYELLIDWYKSLTTRKDFRGPRKAEGRITSYVLSRVDDLKAIVFDADRLTIDSVKVTTQSQQMVPVAFSVASKRLTMPLPSSLKRGEQVAVTIWYAIQTDAGYMNIWHAEDAAVNEIPGGSAYTFAQPEGARTWMPCNDRPSDKAYFTVAVRVPKGYVPVSNGVELSKVADGDTASLHMWQHDEMMPTYLLTVNAGTFVKDTMSYKRKDGTTVPVANYHFEADRNGQVYNANKALANTQLWFESLEEKFGPYPYKTYGHVTVSPIDFGGMEHQTMSTINRFWLRGTAELGYVHELGHQWIGDYVTCATWADIWLNEGGASFSEALYGEYVKGKESYAKVLRNKRDRYMRRGLAEPPVYNIPLAMIFNEATTYNKSSWVYHMMRRMVGDSLFFPTLRSYMAKYAHGSAQTYQFKQHFVENIPNPAVSWDVFFDQWLVKAGHPRFFALVSKPSTPSGATVPVTIKVSQTQLQVIPTLFEVPLLLRVQWGSRWYDTTIVMTTPTVEVKYEFPNDGSLLSFPDPASPASLIDPEESLLCERLGEIVTSVQDEGQVSGIRLVGPTPARDVVTVEVSDGAPVTCTWIGLNGEVLATSIIDSGIRILDVASLPSGMLHLRMERAGTTAVFAVPVIH